MIFRRVGLVVAVIAAVGATLNWTPAAAAHARITTTTPKCSDGTPVPRTSVVTSVDGIAGTTLSSWRINGKPSHS